MRTADVLRKRGIQLSEERFAALLDDALEGHEEAPAPDPRRVLTTAEARTLASGGADLGPRTPVEPGPRAELAAALGAVLADSLTVASAADLLGVDQSRVRHRLMEGTLYGIRLRSGWRLPSFQFGPDGVIPGVDVVLATLPKDLHPVALWRWLTTPNVDLPIDEVPVSPLDWLKGGGSAEPVEALAGSL